ncbi:MipA/OmpV family protein [Roseicitreum antarcticum]|uniref:Outer membrane protein n=1 Tax=Roseicitreum antarcticum TaxID=564137 RepID=A0A1H3A6R1_9RHOB|nr:MipA/OmpV family protein [Roseicitreum antarcticum]SDX25326.1 outer membrane protein [Roseicitreum antarcticum]
MSSVSKTAFAAAAAMMLASGAAHAQSAPALEFSVYGGGAVGPAYPGSDDYDVSPGLGLSFGYLSLRGFQFGAVGGASFAPGLSLSPSVNIRGERTSADHADLAGLPDVDRAYELGLRLSYTTEDWQVFGAVRRGFEGHTGIVGEIGGNVIYRPNEQWTLNIGPRATFGNAAFTDTYFGVAPGGAVLATPYTAGGGIVSTGLEVGAQYRINRDWAVEGAVSYSRLRGSAADSPISRAGSLDQYGASIGLRRYFRIGG